MSFKRKRERVGWEGVKNPGKSESLKKDCCVMEYLIELTSYVSHI